MAPVFPLRLPPQRRSARGRNALLALAVLVIALSALAAPPPGAAYSCSAGEGRVPSNLVYDCRGPVKAPKKKSRNAKAEEAGRIGATPLILLLLALGGTLALPIGFDRMSRREGYEPDQFLR
jgi:hypothetical protein